MTSIRAIVVTIMLVVCTVFYFLFLCSTGALAPANAGPIGRFDLHIARVFCNLRDDGLIRFFTLVTAFGSWRVVFLLAAAASLLLGLARRSSYLPGLWMTLVGSQTVNQFLKDLFLRARPDHAVYQEVSSSFPSGHSAASVALFGFLTYVMLRERSGPKLLVLIGGISVITLVGLSRLVLGEHYPSDVLSGYLVGAVWLSMGICLTELRSRNGMETGVKLTPRRRRAAFVVISFTAIALYFVVKTYTSGLQPAHQAASARLQPPDLATNVEEATTEKPALLSPKA